jgi:2-polyprenyl-3-methyl-5-hydroxy-6-metoxy-1,4-benzoquinol methylase
MWKERFENNLKNSLETHPREYLDSWYSSHIFGTYPLKKINPIELPKSLLENFHISKEHIYFNERQLNLKHFLMLRQWIDFYFNRFVAKPTIIDFGCGLGCFGWVARYLNVDYKGVDISKWATENNPYNLNIVEGNIVNYKDKDFPSSLVLCIDILEHLEEEELEKALENIKTQGKLFIFSIPFLGNPDLFSDKSHKLFKTREEWKNILSKYFNLELPPMDWLYKEQILIGVPK